MKWLEKYYKPTPPLTDKQLEKQMSDALMKSDLKGAMQRAGNVPPAPPAATVPVRNIPVEQLSNMEDRIASLMTQEQFYKDRLDAIDAEKKKLAAQETDVTKLLRGVRANLECLTGKPKRKVTRRKPTSVKSKTTAAMPGVK